jgi:hypothetical protein
LVPEVRRERLRGIYLLFADKIPLYIFIQKPQLNLLDRQHHRMVVELEGLCSNALLWFTLYKISR